SESMETDAVIDVADLPRAKTIYWRPSWLWIPVAAAAAALIVALVVPHFPGRMGTQVAGNQGTVGKQVNTATAIKSYPVAHETVTKSTPPDQSIASAGHPDKPEPPSGNGSSQPEKNVFRPQETVPETRLAVSNPDLPVAPKAVPRPPTPDALPVRVRDEPGGMVAMTAPIQDTPREATPSILDPAKPAVSAVAAAAVVRQPVEGQVSGVMGNVYITRLAAGRKVRTTAQAGINFQPGDLIESGPSSGSFLRYADGSTVRLYSNTQLTLGRAGSSRDLTLSSGAVDLQVQPMRNGSNLIVRTVFVDARVVGTDFRVMTDAKGSWVGVRGGRVEVVRTRANGEVVLLEPGYFASSVRGWPPTAMSDPNWRNKCQLFTGSPRYP
ncbi:MAG: FecR domain-containing protein, partial [bacterium]